MDSVPVYLRDACETFASRAKALGYKGLRADVAALDYFLGLTMGARLAGDKAMGDHFERVAVLIIATRGMGEVRRIASLPARKRRDDDK